MLSTHPPTLRWSYTDQTTNDWRGTQCALSATHATWGARPTAKLNHAELATERAGPSWTTALSMTGVTRVDRRHRHGQRDPTRPTCTRIALNAQRAPRGLHPLSLSSPFFLITDNNMTIAQTHDRRLVADL